MSIRNEIGIFWDYETLKIPKGYQLNEISNEIIQFILKFGEIKIQKFYYNLNKYKNNKENQFKEFNWTLIDCSKILSCYFHHHNDNNQTIVYKKETTLENKMLVDILNFAWERISRQIKTTVVLITTDEDYSYVISKLRDIGVTTILIHGFVEDTSDILLDCCDVSLCWDEIFNSNPSFDVIDIDVSECVSEVSDNNYDDNDNYNDDGIVHVCNNDTSENEENNVNNSLEVEYDHENNDIYDDDEESLLGEQIETDMLLLQKNNLHHNNNNNNNKNSTNSLILSPSDLLTLSIENSFLNDNDRCEYNLWNPSLDEPIFSNSTSLSTSFTSPNHNNSNTNNFFDFEYNNYSLFSPSLKGISSSTSSLLFSSASTTTSLLFDPFYSNDNFRNNDFCNSQNQITSLSTSINTNTNSVTTTTPTTPAPPAPTTTTLVSSSSFLSSSPTYNLWQSLPSNEILKLIHNPCFSTGG